MMPGLMDGVKVLDFTTAFVGPFCSRIMADMGADVIKVERPSSDPRNRYDQPDRFTPEGIKTSNGISYLHLNGGKRSLSVDLKDPRGLELIRSLVKQVDIFVQNFTPHVVRSYGLDYPNLRALNPGIIMCSMTGYGSEGFGGNPEHVCTDPIAQAMSGLNWITGERGGDPYTIGGGIGDTITGTMGAMAVGYALFYRERTGVGQHIDLSMIESLLFMDSTAMPYVAANKGAAIHHRNGKQNTYTFPMGVLKAKEGYIVLQAPGEGPESAWGRLCMLMDRPDLIEEPLYKTDADRIARTEEIVAIIEGWLQTMSDDESALAVLAEDRISSGPVLSQRQIWEHPHFRSRGAFQIIDYPELGPIEVVAPPYRSTETVAKVRGPAPQPGEHNYEVLTSCLGLTTAEIDELTDEGVLYESEAARKRRLALSAVD